MEELMAGIVAVVILAPIFDPRLTFLTFTKLARLLFVFGKRFNNTNDNLNGETKMIGRKSRILFVWAGFLSSLCCTGAFAADLFENGQLRPIRLRDSVPQTATVGGFAIYPGSDNWLFENGGVNTGTGGASGTPIGTVRMTQWEGLDLAVAQQVTATLRNADGVFWGGSPCSPDHIVVNNKGRGREDHCMTIDAVSVPVASKLITFFSMKLTHSNAGRFYQVDLLINPRLFGFEDTGAVEWGSSYQDAFPEKKAFMGRLANWGNLMLDASTKAFDFSQPKDAYANVPSLASLKAQSKALPQPLRLMRTNWAL
jgi:hypothetical protein